MSKCYIEIVGSVTAWSIQLTLWDRFRIGKFTRENVARRLGKYIHPLADGLHPVDFHAVCGDIEIPWALKRAATATNGRRHYSPENGIVDVTERGC